MVLALSHMEGVSGVLPEFNVAMAVAAMPPREWKTWVKIALQSAKQMRIFARKLKAEAAPKVAMAAQNLNQTERRKHEPEANRNCGSGD
jgi:hypothetical protein